MIKKILLFLLPIVLGCIVFFSTMYILTKTDKGKGALQVTANPKADVYLDSKLLGKSPFCKCNLPDMLPVGNHMIKIVPQDTTLSPFEQQISINKSVITVVDVNFGENNNTTGSIISLNPLANTNSTQMFITSFPDHANVFLDKDMKGETPMLLRDVTPSDHDILFEKDGYQSKVLHVHTVKGYTLSAVAFLAVTPDLNATQTPTPSGQTATPSGSLTPSLSPSPSGSPTPTGTGSQVLILETPTGFLRVRATPNPYGTVVGQVNPGQTFPLVDEQNGWYEITLTDGSKGWISVQYAKKQ